MGPFRMIPGKNRQSRNFVSTRRQSGRHQHRGNDKPSFPHAQVIGYSRSLDSTSALLFRQ